MIGGARTYRTWLPYVDRFLIGRIRGEYECDTYCEELKIWGPDVAVVRLDRQCRDAVASALDLPRGDFAWSYLLQQIKERANANA